MEIVQLLWYPIIWPASVLLWGYLIYLTIVLSIVLIALLFGK